MKTECTPTDLRSGRLGTREIRAGFDGGKLSSDGGAILLRMTEQRTRLLRRFAGCFRDYRSESWVEHSVEELVAQRVMGLVLGYEDLNDHDRLRFDTLLAVAVGKREPESRKKRDQEGPALASSSTLNRLELASDDHENDRYKKIAFDPAAADQLLFDHFAESVERREGEAPEEIVLDLDTTDLPLHGHQEGRFFHGYYRCYCYLPLYVFCGDYLLAALLQTSDKDGARNAQSVCARLVAQVRERWPGARVVVRGDSGFCRNELMSWCEENEVDYVFGLAKNSRVVSQIEDELEIAKELHKETGLPERVYAEFDYRTIDSWDRSRRVVAKAEHLEKGSNPRFVVTSFSRETVEAHVLYEHGYCQRGEMENRIKEQQLDLFATRASGATLRANQLRLYFSAIAYALIQALRDLGLAETSLQRAQANTIRLKLFKIAARVRVTARRVWLQLSSACPLAELFAEVHANLAACPVIAM